MSSDKIRIAIDLDDVLFDFIGEFFEWHNEFHGTSLVSDETVFEKLWEAWGGTKEEAAERIPQFFQELDMLQVAPIDGAVDTIHRLNQTFSLTIVSARDPESLQITNEWVDRYFPGIFDEVILGIGNPMAEGRVRSKTDVCLELNAILLIEDQLVHALDAAEAGIPVLLFGDKPWNQIHELPPRVRRVAAWPEIRAILQDEGWLNPLNDRRHR